jgi:hypothetical protein
MGELKFHMSDGGKRRSGFVDQEGGLGSKIAHEPGEDVTDPAQFFAMGEDFVGK